MFNRKRQRRQAAAVVVDSLFNNAGGQPQQASPQPYGQQMPPQQQQQQPHTTPMGRKSTAQPRPVLNVPPRGIGPIVEPNQNDVLSGRGGRINSHSGNVQFRNIINAHKKEYLAPATKKLEKAHIAAGIVNDIRAMDPPGRFLKEDRDTGLWFDIGDAKAIKKTGQALREDAPDIRHELEDDGSSGDEKHSPKGSSNDAISGAKKEEKKHSPKATARPKVPINNSSPLQFSRQTGHGPQQMPGMWNQQGSGSAAATPYDFQAQAAMPPPNASYPSQQQQQQQQFSQGQGFATRNIPLSMPVASSGGNSLSYMPQNLYSGAKSISNKASTASKQAFAALNPNAAMYQNQAQQLPPDDIAFGRAFHPPETNTTISGTDNTMSTISGLSEPLSSTFGPNSLMSGKSRTEVQNTSLRLSNIGSSLRGSSAMNMSSTNWARGAHSISSNSNNIPSANLVSNGSSAAAQQQVGQLPPPSSGSLTRSFSFNDMGSIMDGDNWKAIMEADDDQFDNETAMAKSILSSGSRNGRFNNSSGMSISGMSLDLASTASSTQWLAANGLMGNQQGGNGPSAPPMPDDRTYLSGMSTDLDALDLASTF